MHVAYANTSAHMHALKPTNTCRWRENTSCLIRGAQQSIFFLWHLRKLDTAQPIPVQYFWGDNKASRCSVSFALLLLPRTNYSTLSVLLTAERVIGRQLLPIKELPSTRSGKKGHRRFPPTGPTQATTCWKGKRWIKLHSRWEKSAELHKGPDLPSPYLHFLGALLRSHQRLTLPAIQKLFCAEAVVISSLFFPFWWILRSSSPSFSTFTLDHFLLPQENERELVLLGFEFYVEVMSNSRRSSDTDSKRTRFFPSEKRENHILLLITQLVCWMHCTLVPWGYCQ